MFTAKCAGNEIGTTRAVQKGQGSRVNNRGKKFFGSCEHICFGTVLFRLLFF